MKEKYLKFNPQSAATLEQIKTSKAGIIREKIDNNEELTNEEKRFITKSVYNNGFFKTSVAVLGWAINFSDVLKRYWVKGINDCNIFEIYATSENELFDIIGDEEIEEYHEMVKA